MHFATELNESTSLDAMYHVAEQCLTGKFSNRNSLAESRKQFEQCLYYRQPHNTAWYGSSSATDRNRLKWGPQSLALDEIPIWRVGNGGV